MNLYFRLLWLRLTVRRRSALGAWDVARLPMRVVLRDIDQAWHVNNGVYLTMMDLGRLDLMWRTGMWKPMIAAGFYPVVAAQTITYRKSLTLRQGFEIETRLLGSADKALFVEQRFVVAGEIYARAIVKARFVKRTGGTVSIEELSAVAGEDFSAVPVDQSIRRWAAETALPPTRAEAPSDWS